MKKFESFLATTIVQNTPYNSEKLSTLSRNIEIYDFYFPSYHEITTWDPDDDEKIGNICF